MSSQKAFIKVKKKQKDRLGGRPETLTQELIEKIIGGMRTGSYIETAAVSAGISKAILYEWLKRGNREPGTIYARFVDAVHKAFADAETRDLNNIDRCALGRKWDYERYPPGSTDHDGRDISGQLVLNSAGNPIIKQIGLQPNWKASAWRLERKFPKKWGRTQTIEYVETEEKKLSEMSLEELQAELDHLESFIGSSSSSKD